MCMCLLPVALLSCNNDDNEVDTSYSVFDDTNVEGEEPNEFDNWLLKNYIYPYNIQVKYRLDDNETDVEYDLVPADYEKALRWQKL